jgi:hypothetical protein
MLAGAIVQVAGGLRTVGELVPFYVCSGMMVIGTFLLASLPKSQLPKEGRNEGLIQKILSLLIETLRFVRKTPRIIISFLLLIFVELNVGLMGILFLEYIHQYLKLPLISISSSIILPFVIGLVIGIVALTVVQKRFLRRNLIFISCLTTGILYILLGVLPLLFAQTTVLPTLRLSVSLVVGVIGFFIVQIAVPSRTILQLTTPKEMYGRVFSLLDMLIAITTPIPVLITGFFASQLSILTVFILIGGGTVFLGILGHLQALKRLRV